MKPVRVAETSSHVLIIHVAQSSSLQANMGPHELRTQFYLNGDFHEPISRDTYILHNPKDNTIVSDKVPIAGAEDVDAAVKHAEAAFNGPWSKFSAAQRRDCFQKLIDLLEEELVPILTLDSLTTGNPVSLIPTREKNYIKGCLSYYGSSIYTERL